MTDEQDRRPSDNPYAPPASLSEPASLPRPAAAQSGAPRVFGILSIVFGSLMILGGLGQIASGLFTGAMGTMMDDIAGPDAGAELEQMRNAYAMLDSLMWVQVVQGLIFAGMSIWLLVVGIGQLRYRRWAALHSNYWGAAALISLVLICGLSIGVVGPAYQDFFDAMMQSMPADEAPPPPEMGGLMGAVGGIGSAIGMILFYAPYPVLLLAFFSRPRIRASMAR